MNLVLFGPPGSGKGTLSSRLVDFNFVPISTGDLLRGEVRKETDLGRKIKKIMENGELVADDLMVNLIYNQVNKSNDKNYLLDGFPRTISQALALEKIVKVDQVINLVVGKELLFKRILGRRVCYDCNLTYNIYYKAPTEEGNCDQCDKELSIRKDDNEESLSNRLEIYYRESDKIIEYYKKADKLFEVDASIEAQDIFIQVKKQINL